MLLLLVDYMKSNCMALVHRVLAFFYSMMGGKVLRTTKLMRCAREKTRLA